MLPDDEKLTDQTQDNFYAQVHLTADASVTLCSGACVTKTGVAGINRFSQPMTPGQGISVEIKRNGQMTTRLNPSFTFQGGADRPNFSMSLCFPFGSAETFADDRLLDQVLVDVSGVLFSVWVIMDIARSYAYATWLAILMKGTKPLLVRHRVDFLLPRWRVTE